MIDYHYKSVRAKNKQCWNTYYPYGKQRYHLAYEINYQMDHTLSKEIKLLTILKERIEGNIYLAKNTENGFLKHVQT